MPDIPVAVVAHHSRRDHAERLASSLHAHLLMDDGDATTVDGRVRRSLANHVRAWEWAATQPQRAIILEDDVDPVDDMRDRAAEWFERFPDDLIGFYLGTGWEHIEAASIAALEAYDAGGDDYVRLDTLWGAQCYSIPTAHLPWVLANRRRDLAADFALGAAWQARHHRDIVHTLESLVEHDGQPSTVWPGGRGPRHARRLHVPTPSDRRRPNRTPHSKTADQSRTADPAVP